jgi:hypothetical protein
MGIVREGVGFHARERRTYTSCDFLCGTQYCDRKRGRRAIELLYFGTATPHTQAEIAPVFRAAAAFPERRTGLTLNDLHDLYARFHDW